MAWVKVGDEVRVDAGLSAAIAALGGGGFVVGWSTVRDYFDGPRAIVAHQSFLSSNVRVDPITPIDGYDGARQIVLVGPQIGIPGGFVVDYVSYARVLLNEFIPSVYYGGGEMQIDPALTTAGDGNALAFVFYSGGADIALVVRDPDLPQARVVVNTTTAVSESDPDVAELAGGGFAVAWEAGAAIRGRVLTASGGTVAATPLDFEISAGGRDPGVAALAGGGFIVTWRALQPGAPADGPGDLMGRLYDPDGVAVGGEIPLVVGADDQSYPDVAALPGGGFALLWLDSPAGSERTVRIQFFDDAGVPDGDPIIVNAGGAAVGPPALAVLDDGSIAVTWTEADGVYTQVLAEDADAAVTHGDAGANALSGTAGMDELNGLGGADALAGLDGDDSLFGGDGDDVLDGGAGADRLFGGRGVDVMSGGAGDDLYAIDDAADQVLENAGGGFDQVAAHASYALQAGSEIELLLAAYQYGEAAINLTGNGFANTLRGNNGANVLDGGGGADVLQGYIGDDTYVFDSVEDQLIEWSHQGNDTLRTSVSIALHADWSIETLRAADPTSTAALNLTGNAESNRIEGNAGANILDGGGGDDVLVGFGGADWYFVDSNDVIIDNSAGNRVFASTDYTLGAGVVADILSTTLHAGTAAINLTGNGFGNTIYGNAGANVLDGREGGDRLYGLAGDDSYIVDNAGDMVFESAGGGVDVVRVMAGLTYTLAAGAHVETLLIHNDHNVPTNLFGNELANAIIGNNSANTLGGGGGNDVLHGFGGDDLLQGGAGDDILHGGAGANDLMGGTGNDWYYVSDVRDAIFDGLDEGAADRVYTSVSYTLAEAARIEILSTADHSLTTALNLTGNSYANTMFGNAGSNFLDGRGGADVMIGLAGDDYYSVDHAGDRVTEAAGQGADIVFASVSYVLGAGQHIERLSTNLYTETTAIDLTGNELANNIAGNAGVNRLNGGAGRDMLTGLAGADAFLFDTALNTAPGASWASLGASANVDYITDFDAADRIELDVDIFSALGLGGLSSNAFAIGTGAADASDRIIYDPATGALLYDSDGAGGAAALQFAVLRPGLTMSADDFFGV